VAILFLIIHIIVCLILELLLRTGILKSTRMGMALAWLVPLWGIGCLLVSEIRSRGRQEARQEVGIEKLKINDEIYRSIFMEEDHAEGLVVPLEEAFLINDFHTRRGLMMEVMYSNPDDYVSQLQEARMNDDTEVVHYAVTALVELQKEYDLQFQKLDRELARYPDDRKRVNLYLELLERYLESGLLEGNSRNLQLRNYSGLLQKKLEGSGEILPVYIRKIEADLELGEYETAYQDIQRVLQQWPKDERGYLCLLQYYSLVKNREGIDHVLYQIGRKHIYLSPKGRAVRQFWDKSKYNG